MPHFQAPAGVQLVLVDFDDTLVATAPRFQEARRELFELLGRLGFDPHQARRVHHQEIDPEMLARWGFGPSRLPFSFRATYARLCASAGLICDDSILDACDRLARSVPGEPTVIDGALEALRRLEAVFPTAVYTQSGDRAYQLGCLREAGVLDILPADRIRICERKCVEDFRAALDQFAVSEPAGTWMIGNSLRSDVNPALEAGARAIWIEVDDPWEHDHAAPLSADFVRVRSFSEAVGYLLRHHSPTT